MEIVRVIRDTKNTEKPKLLPDNKIEIFAPKKLRLKAAEYQQSDSGVVIVLPEKVETFGFVHLFSDSKIKIEHAAKN